MKNKNFIKNLALLIVMFVYPRKLDCMLKSIRHDSKHPDISFSYEPINEKYAIISMEDAISEAICGRYDLERVYADTKGEIPTGRDVLDNLVCGCCCIDPPGFGAGRQPTILALTGRNPVCQSLFRCQLPSRPELCIRP